MLRQTFGALMIGTVLATSVPAVAQQADAATLADLRQQLSVLHVDIQRLKRELSTTGAPGGGTQGGTLLSRVDSIEAEMTRLTNRVEELGHRVETVVESGTNRVNDLNFRLCELEPGCDVSTLQDMPRLGGADASANMPVSPIAPAGGAAAPTTELAMSEQADFDSAQAAYAEGRFADAAAGFATFVETYPGSPLTADAHLGRARALKQVQDTRESARAYLQAFSTDPEGPGAAEALTGLGTALGALGQNNEACVTLSEVSVRFPGDPAVADATDAMGRLGCS
ncbi:tol-pal system protein YbgF [Donghicola mangrovi]|uniref:Cell division coordinator CpoB n=1 Tax=Donghicola mangrovi TaxID=2729614 RepID=A0A850QDV4_9RHOB|nr:tol-pal system protein YbgF [Donghicola mangrovi]NVO25128.1 tol-pal system protein YbgF [Donghicola mangrovi]